MNEICTDFSIVKEKSNIDGKDIGRIVISNLKKFS